MSLFCRNFISSKVTVFRRTPVQIQVTLSKLISESIFKHKSNPGEHRFTHSMRNRNSSQVSVKAATLETQSVLSDSDEGDIAPAMVDKKYLSNTRFSEFLVSEDTKRAIAEVLKFEFCSIVQASAIPVCLKGTDVVAKAKTGTGKTLAFMIPTIEQVLKHRAPPGKVSALVLSPTRELARQIQVETQKVLTFHNLKSLVVYGGVDVKKNLTSLRSSMPDILIATPGRCLDLMTQEKEPGLRDLLSQVQVLIMDEADNLLDMGFRPQINQILKALPKVTQRQTLLFSATFPSDLKALLNVAVKPQHTFVDAVGEDVDTHVHVEQSAVVESLPLMSAQLLNLLLKHIAVEREYKIIVFFPTANMTAFYADVFKYLGLPIIEMHSRMSQPQRDKASAEFRSGSASILFSSDVSARGVDYPNVTYVLQFGAPSNRDQYVHRTGRTGRAGKAGRSTLLLADFERSFLNRLTDIPLDLMSPLQAADSNVALALERAVGYIDVMTKKRAYQAFLGYYNSHQDIKMAPVQLVSTANLYAQYCLGQNEPPALSAKTAGKMGLRKVAGIRVMTRDEEAAEGQLPRGGNPRPIKELAELAGVAAIGTGGLVAAIAGPGGSGQRQKEAEQPQRQQPAVKQQQQQEVVPTRGQQQSYRQPQQQQAQRQQQFEQQQQYQPSGRQQQPQQRQLQQQSGRGYATLQDTRRSEQQYAWAEESEYSNSRGGRQYSRGGRQGGGFERERQPQSDYRACAQAIGNPNYNFTDNFDQEFGGDFSSNKFNSGRGPQGSAFGNERVPKFDPEWEESREDEMSIPSLDGQYKRKGYAGRGSVQRGGSGRTSQGRRGGQAQTSYY